MRIEREERAALYADAAGTVDQREGRSWGSTKSRYLTGSKLSVGIEAGNAVLLKGARASHRESGIKQIS